MATRTSWVDDDRSPESIRMFRGRGDGTFSRATSIDVGGDPYRGMVLADVTDDGLADLITPNPDHVAVLVAGQDGGFRPPATLPAPFGPFSVVAADLNGDGSGFAEITMPSGGPHSSVSSVGLLSRTTATPGAASGSVKSSP